MPARNEIDTRWGLRAIAPDDARAVWGARTILEAGSFSIVNNRQDIHGITAGDCKDLAAALNTRILDDCRQVVSNLLRSSQMRGNEREQFELYDDTYFRVVANTQGSCGYLYVTAWFKAHDETPIQPWWAQDSER